LHEDKLVSAGIDTLSAEAPVAGQVSDPACPVTGLESSHPELPVTVIERRSGWQFVNVAEMWRFRELLYFLVWRDIKVRYKQTMLGAAWAVLQPLAMAAVVVLFLGRLTGVQDAKGPTIPYELFVFAGMIPWTFFNSAIGGASNSVVANSNIITKIYFPRLLLPFATVAAALLDLFIAFLLLLVFMPMPFPHILPGWGLLAVPLVLVVLLGQAAGLGTLLAALTVKYRDFRSIVTLALQLWMFATPAIYLYDWKGPFGRYAPLLPLNPLHGVILNFRAATVGADWDWSALAISAAWALVLLVVGCLYFRRVEPGFVDVI
jgi:lipopolysaccharide transport system permease protein